MGQLFSVVADDDTIYQRKFNITLILTGKCKNFSEFISRHIGEKEVSFY